MFKLNETPVRTSRNFNINNIKLKDVNMPEIINDFTSYEIINKTDEINVETAKSDFNIIYGLGDILVNQVKKSANKNIKLIIDGKKSKEAILQFNFDKANNTLVENIEIVAEKGANATIIIKYESDKGKNYFHNGIIRLAAKENSNINIVIANFLNEYSNNFITIENTLESNANVDYTIIDFGGKNSITNYYSNLIGEKSKNNINTIYLGKDSQLFDLNYIGELRGEKSLIDIEVIGAIKDEAKKHFKGTIDFKKGAKKAKGNENEYCMLLSDKAKSIALPMLLCSEEDVEGNHSSSAGKIGEKELFYIMSRGFELKEAMKLMVRAKFNKILTNIKNDELKGKILEEIDKRLD